MHLVCNSVSLQQADEQTAVNETESKSQTVNTQSSSLKVEPIFPVLFKPNHLHCLYNLTWCSRSPESFYLLFNDYYLNILTYCFYILHSTEVGIFGHNIYFCCLECRGNLIVLRLIRSWKNGLTILQLWFVYISHTFKGSWYQHLAKEWWINIYQRDFIPYMRSSKNKAVPKTIKEKGQTHLR